MRKLLGISTAALVVAFAAPAAFASIIPNLTTEGLVTGGADFTYRADLTVDQEIDTLGGANPNTLTLSGGALGSSTTLVGTPSGFLGGFTFTTGANSITFTCSSGGCNSDTNGLQSSNFTIFSPDSGQTLGSFNATATKNDPNVNDDETATVNSGRVTVPSPVPEPATLALFGAALAGLGLLGRRRRKHA